MKDQKLYLDEDLFLEVLDNLLSNANRYAESHVEILTETEGDILYLFVSDNGVGFSEDALLNASHLYFSEGTKEEHFGIGLNLSLFSAGNMAKMSATPTVSVEMGLWCQPLPNSEGNLKKSFHLFRENLGKSLV